MQTKNSWDRKSYFWNYIEDCKLATISVTRKNRQMSKKSPKMISQEKWKILTPLQKMPKNVGDFGQ